MRLRWLRCGGWYVRAEAGCACAKAAPRRVVDEAGQSKSAATHRILRDERADGGRQARRETTGGEHGDLLWRVGHVGVLTRHLWDSIGFDHGWATR